MSEKTHYRKAFNSPYLAAADIVGPTVLHIAFVRLESDLTKKTKDLFNTAHFAEKELRKGEKLKPMILNATNSKTIREMTDSHYIEDWKDVAVVVYVDSAVKFGRDTVEGLRISKDLPKFVTQAQADELMAKCADTDTNVDQFCKHLDVATLDVLLASKFQGAIHALAEKAKRIAAEKEAAA